MEVEGAVGADYASFPESQLPAASTTDREAGGFYWESASAGKQQHGPKHIHHQQRRDRNFRFPASQPTSPAINQEICCWWVT